MRTSKLNLAQQKAVKYGQGPLLVVAGAGTGKTEIIVQRILYLINAGLAKPNEILALTFTDKAANEMEERVDRALPLGSFDVRIMTFNAFGDQLLRRYGIEIGLSMNFKLMTVSQQLVFLREHFDELKLNYFAPIAQPTSLLGALIKYFSRLRDEMITPDKYLKYAQKIKSKAQTAPDRLEAKKQLELARAYNIYTCLKQQKACLDFGDQVALTLELFRKRPNILKEIQAEIKFILVDEFQDTNLAQNHLLELLATLKGNITVVGDDDQSIYKFRGAAISNILKFSDNFKKTKQIVLTKNYRSTKQILNRAYQLIQYNNPNRLEFKYQINKKLLSNRVGPEPQLLVASNSRAEANLIATTIKDLLKQKEDPADIAVLVRKRVQIEPIARALLAEGIPYHIGPSHSLFEADEVKQVLHFIYYLTNPDDSLSLFHLLTGKIYRLDPTEVAKLNTTAKCKNLSLHQVIFDLAHSDLKVATIKKLEHFKQDMEKLWAISSDLSVSALVYEFVKGSGWLSRLNQQVMVDPSIELNLKNLGRFFDHLIQYETTAELTTVHGYVEQLAGLKQIQDRPEVFEIEDIGGDAVWLLTIHQAKGLEYNSVFLYDLTKDTFPSIDRKDTLTISDALLKQEILPVGNWHIQEERRLMYVAMTRAKTNLYLSYSPDHLGKKIWKPSPFLAEALTPKVSLSDLNSKPLFNTKMTKYQASPVVPTKFKMTSSTPLLLTPHQIADYLICPANYYYRYVLNMALPQLETTAYGNLIHHIVNYYYAIKAEKNSINQAKLIQLIDELWPTEGFNTLEHERRRKHQAYRTIKHFWNREEQAAYRPIYHEKSFRLEVPKLNATIKGRIDVVLQHADGKIEIRDFKTSQISNAQQATRKARTDIQLAIYGLAWQKLKGHLPDLISLDFLDTNQIGIIKFSQKDIEKITTKIERVVNGIRAGRFDKSANCQNCIHP